MLRLFLFIIFPATATKADSDTAPCELVYGSSLRLPSKFFLSSPQLLNVPTDSTFVHNLQASMRKLQPVRTRSPSAGSVTRSTGSSICNEGFPSPRCCSEVLDESIMTVPTEYSSVRINTSPLMMASPLLRNIFVLRVDATHTAAVTRGQTTSMLALPTVKSRFDYHSIAYLAADRWNSLPSHCRLCESSAHFIHTIKSLLGYPVIS